MTQPDTDSRSPEDLVAEASAGRELRYADKQDLKSKEYRKVVRGFRTRSQLMMYGLGVVTLYHLSMLVLRLTMGAPESTASWMDSTVSWGRLLMLAVFGYGFVFFQRDVRRCTDILHKLDAAA
ncbi:MAG: hypothetical protein DHS20C15_27400 [Planctomycetota bacterium]|nr:MAG: hypothetical protein DHS20C15_27400 [Planctomycetota bacterium]